MATSSPELNDHADIEIFDPPMCCPTGLCGPTLDQVLLDLNEMIMDLQNQGYRVERFQMASNPQAFLDNPVVIGLIREKQLDALPVVIVRGKLLVSGRYPNHTEIQAIIKGGK